MSLDVASGSTSPPAGLVVRRALAWSFANNALARVGGLVVSVVLARLLVPADFGAYAVALVVLTGLLSCNDMGVSLAIIRWSDDARRIAGTVNCVAVSLSASLTLGVMVFASPLAVALGAPSAAGVIRLLCLAALIDGVSAVPAALLARDFRQKETTLVELVGLMASGAVSLVLAMRGHGAYSLAWGQLAGNSLVALLLIMRSRPYPGFSIAPDILGPLLRFGIPLAASSGLVFLMINLDYIVVGRVLGSTDLGLYFLAFSLANAPVKMLSVALRRVTMPAFARTRREGGDLGEAFRATTSAVLIVVVPGATFLAMNSSALVELVYGDKWSGASRAFAVLSVFAIVRAVADLAYDLLATLGQSRRVLLVQALWVAALAAALPLGALSAGIAGVAAAHLAVGALLIIPAFSVALQRSGVPVRPLIRGAVRPLLAGALVVVTSTAGTIFVSDDEWFSLAVGAGAAGAGVAVLGWPVLRALWCASKSGADGADPIAVSMAASGGPG